MVKFDHKKGSVNVTDNYRGICLSSISSKIFTRILNVRLQKWADDNKLISGEQAGFRRGYSTIDNAFILNSFVQKYLDKRSKVYVAFIDYRKAFDSVNTSVLWKILCKNGIIGKMLVILQGIYEDVRCNVRCDKGETDFSQSSGGLKHGCILSPLLFYLPYSSCCKWSTLERRPRPLISPWCVWISNFIVCRWYCSYFWHRPGAPTEN